MATPHTCSLAVLRPRPHDELALLKTLNEQLKSGDVTVTRSYGLLGSAAAVLVAAE